MGEGYVNLEELLHIRVIDLKWVIELFWAYGLLHHFLSPCVNPKGQKIKEDILNSNLQSYIEGQLDEGAKAVIKDIAENFPEEFHLQSLPLFFSQP